MASRWNTRGPGPSPKTPSIAGHWHQILDRQAIRDPEITQSRNPQVVDHCFFRAASGAWQAWVQVRDTTVGRVFTRWEQAGRLTDAPWRYEGICWQADQKAGESVGTGSEEKPHVIQAPFVLHDRDRYVLVYGGGPVDPGDTTRQVCMATSQDGIEFVRTKDALGRSRIAVGPCHASDAFLFKQDDAYYLYTCAAYHDTGSARSALTVRRSVDLEHWSEPTVAHAGGTCGTHTHSSQSEYVLFRDGLFYLFIMGWSNDLRTAVYWSTDPTDFGEGDQYLVTVLPVSAAEIIEFEGRYWISSLVLPGYNGIRIAPLTWTGT